MSTQYARIDCRLVHGQVANLWVPKLGISRVIVIDDKVANSDLEKTALRMATPANVRLSVLTTERATQNLIEDRYHSQNLLLIAKKPSTFRKLVEQGVSLPQINVGNMAQTNDSKSLTKSINAEPQDIEDFKALNAAGVSLISQMVPQASGENFGEILEKLEIQS